MNAAQLQSMQFPHRFRMLTVRGLYLRLSVLLLLLLALAAVRGGAQVLVPVLAAVAAALGAELLAGLLVGDSPGGVGANGTGARVSAQAGTGSGIVNGRALYIGLMVAALAPLGASPGQLALASGVATALGVWMIGGTGVLWVHPSLLALALVPWQTGSTGSTDMTVEGSAFVGELLERSGLLRVLEDFVFAPLELSVTPEALISLVSVVPGNVVSLSAGLLLALLPVAMVVFGEDMVPVWLPVAYLLSFVLMVDVLGGSVLAAVAGGNAPVIALLALANPGGRPHRVGGLLVFGVLGGVLGALLTVSGGVALPAVTGVLLASTLVPLADWLGERWFAS